MDGKNIKGSPLIEVEGYTFYTEQDAQLARAERQKIDYLKSKLDFGKTENVYKIYEKAVAERIFRTPVGISFLRELREELVDSNDIDSSTVSPIPLPMSFENEIRSQASPARVRIKPSQKNKLKRALRISVIINLFLGIAVIAMFIITATSDQPNIINYERALTNRYAGWEQDLTQREQAIREKERELSITPENSP